MPLKEDSSKESVVKVYGKTRTVSVTGGRSECLSTYQRPKDMKDSGRTQRRSAVYIEYKYYLRRKILAYSLKDSNKPITIEYVLILLLSTTTILKICQLIKSLRLIMIKLIEY